MKDTFTQIKEDLKNLVDQVSSAITDFHLKKDLQHVTFDHEVAGKKFKISISLIKDTK